MSDIIFEVLKLLFMVAGLVICRYVVPFIREKIGTEKLIVIETWVEAAVLKAQQVLYAESGEDKKAYVTEFVQEILSAKDIAISEEQLDVLIESAVKQMKMEENVGK